MEIFLAIFGLFSQVKNDPHNLFQPLIAKEKGVQLLKNDQKGETKFYQFTTYCKIWSHSLFPYTRQNLCHE